MVQFVRGGGLARAGKNKNCQKAVSKMQAQNKEPVPPKKTKTGRAKMRQQFNKYNDNPKPQHLNRNKQDVVQKESTVFSSKKWALGPTCGLPKLTFHEWIPTRSVGPEQYEFAPRPKKDWWKDYSHHQDTKKRWQMPMILLRRRGYNNDDIQLAKWMPDTVRNQVFSSQEESSDDEGFFIEGPL